MAQVSEGLDRIDQRVFMRIDWAEYEAMARARGESSHPRITYLDGVAELMSPSRIHEHFAAWLSTLIQAYCFEREIIIEPLGSWTLRDRDVEAAAEADACFVFGPTPKDRPDLAIEIVWTSGGLEKLELYRRLRVPEVWFWIDGVLSVHVLGPQGYTQLVRSPSLPALDLVVLAELLDAPTLNEAVRMVRRLASVPTPRST